jgi:cytoskeleton protein RodZ
VSLFQRLKPPFGEMADDHPDPPRSRTRAVGSLLRGRREQLGLDLDTVGEALCIKPVYLDALEQGRAQDLPGPAYAIGFFRAYAEHLGLDSDRILDTYKAETAEGQARPDLALPVPLGMRSLPGGAILMVALILALCGYGTWYYLSTGERTRPERVAAVPADLQRAAAQDAAASPQEAAASPQDASPAAASPAADTPSSGLVASPAVAALPPPAPVPPPRSNSADASSTPAASSAPAGDAGADSDGHIDIRAVADCWIQVRSADQAIVFSGVLRAGETYRVPRAGLFLRTGNAGALAFAVDGKPAPAIGGVGMLRRNVALDPAALLAGTAVRG